MTSTDTAIAVICGILTLLFFLFLLFVALFGYDPDAGLTGIFTGLDFGFAAATICALASMPYWSDLLIAIVAALVFGFASVPFWDLFEFGGLGHVSTYQPTPVKPDPDGSPAKPGSAEPV